MQGPHLVPLLKIRSLLFLPLYKQKLKQEVPVTHSAEKRFYESDAMLQDCTEWNMFCDFADGIDKLTTSVTNFIRKCIADVVPTVKIHCFPNQNPWIYTEVRTKLKDRATAHKAIADNPKAMTEDTNTYKKSLYDLLRAIKKTKGQYRNILHRLRCATHVAGATVLYELQGTASRDLSNDASLPDELNVFYARFDKTALSPAQRHALCQKTG